MDATVLSDADAEDAHKIDRKSVRRPRVELITRGERRRRWSIEQKREIVAESLGADTTPTEVARKHAISSGLLYTWRQQILGGQLGPLVRTVPSFAEVEAAVTPSEVDQPDDTAMRSTSSPTPAASLRVDGQIEIVLASGVVLRVDAQVNERALRRVLAALEAR
jgi:transposase